MNEYGRWKTEDNYRIWQLVNQLGKSRYICKKYYYLFNRSWDATHHFLKEVEGKSKEEKKFILGKWIKATKRYNYVGSK